MLHPHAIGRLTCATTGAVLTGMAYANQTAVTQTISQFSLTAFGIRLANTGNPSFPRDNGYWDFVDIYSHTHTFFHEPYDRDTIKYAQTIYQPGAALEFSSLGLLNLTAPEFTGKVMITTGEHDLLACGGECYSTFETGLQAYVFPAATALKTYVHPGSGHGINFARNATGFFGEIVGFLDSNI